MNHELSSQKFGHRVSKIIRSFDSFLPAGYFLLLVFFVFFEKIVSSLLSKLRFLEIGDLTLDIRVQCEIFNLLKEGHFLESHFDCFDVVRCGFCKWWDDVFLGVYVLQVLIERWIGLFEQVIEIEGLPFECAHFSNATKLYIIKHRLNNRISMLLHTHVKYYYLTKPK